MSIHLAALHRAKDDTGRGKRLAQRFHALPGEGAQRLHAEGHLDDVHVEFRKSLILPSSLSGPVSVGHPVTSREDPFAQGPRFRHDQSICREKT